MGTGLDGIGVVVIGRNEGPDLARCLGALPRGAVPVVYVDSGSTDGSPALARSLGVDVVDLDPAIPFSAARGRNEGAQHLLRAHPELRYLQVVDGDTELSPGWLEAGAAAMAEDELLAAVGGRLRERDARSSLCKRAFDVELETSSRQHTLGTAMYRFAAFREVGGFRSDLKAGEEPELCVRLRRAGWRVARLDTPMGVHDVGPLRVGEWWQRCSRAGRAYAEGATIHGEGPEAHWSWEHKRALVGGVAVPAVALALAPVTLGATVVLLAAGGLVSWTRAYTAARKRAHEKGNAAAWATACVVGRLAEGQGALQFHRQRWLGGRAEAPAVREAA